MQRCWIVHILQSALKLSARQPSVRNPDRVVLSFQVKELLLICAENNRMRSDRKMFVPRQKPTGPSVTQDGF